MKTTINPVITLTVLALLLGACGAKQPTEPTPPPVPSTKLPPAAQPDEPHVPVPAVEAPAPDKVPDPASQVALPFELPEKFFGGTPLPYWSPILEEPSFAPRDPFLAPEGTTIISREKAVASSTDKPTLGKLAQLVDGDKDYAKSSLIELDPGVQWVQLDLGKVSEIYAILLWHFHEGPRVYFDVVVRASNNPEFKGDLTTLYNNDHDNSAGLGVGADMEYVESEQGRLIDARGLKARYLRFHSNGNTANDANHYVEIEVWGRPAE